MGIGPWGAISHRDELDPAASGPELRGEGGLAHDGESTSVLGAVEYTAGRAHNSADGAALEPHHSHFILVDTGRQGRAAWGNEISLRFAIERKVAAHRHAPRAHLQAPRSHPRARAPPARPRPLPRPPPRANQGE